MLPRPIPLLTEEQFEFIENEVKRKPTKGEIERIKRIKKRFKNTKL